jgi:predicted YcjX-like family ATPase
LRLGVTGLARSGKTVFITALVRNLVAGGRLPFFGPSAEGRILSAHLEPQPDDEIPRFDYEAHLAALNGDPPEWPESTRRISELRVSISFLPQSRVRRALGIKRLHVDIVDYPGEWLLDLAMLGGSYASWSADALRLAREPVRRALAREWLDFSSSIDPLGGEDEQ